MWCQTDQRAPREQTRAQHCPSPQLRKSREQSRPPLGAPAAVQVYVCHKSVLTQGKHRFLAILLFQFKTPVQQSAWHMTEAGLNVEPNQICTQQKQWRDLPRTSSKMGDRFHLYFCPWNQTYTCKYVCLHTGQGWTKARTQGCAFHGLWRGGGGVTGK